MTEQKQLTAQQASNAGAYNDSTLNAFRNAWLTNRSPQSLLDYAIFLRQLGTPAKDELFHQLVELEQQSFLKKVLNGLYGHRQRQLKNLIDEANQNASQPAVLSKYKALVSHWRAQQNDWHRELNSLLAQAKSIAIVGNSPVLRGQKCGKEIDSHDVVVRFNQYQSEQTQAEDTGEKLSLWVTAPGYRGPVAHSAAQAIITGPNMVWWQQNWEHLETYKGKLMGVPLSYWRECVQQLEAPPSAGFLVSYYLKEQAEPKKINLYGFGYDQNSNSQYHSALKGHQAVSRHNWAKEKVIFEKWTTKR